MRTLQQETEHVQQEQDTSTIQIGEESFVVDNRQLMSTNIADHIRHAYDDQQHCIHQARNNEERRSGMDNH